MWQMIYQPKKYLTWDLFPRIIHIRGNKSHMCKYRFLPMKKIFQLSALALLPASTNLYAHQTTKHTVDEEIYTIVDHSVVNPAQATPSFDEMGNALTETSITINSLSMFETLVANGDLLEYVESLDGTVDTTISINDNGSVTMTINKVS